MCYDFLGVNIFAYEIETGKFLDFDDYEPYPEDREINYSIFREDDYELFEY